ncbi:unnamed protein product [Eruca vesicaria subsp. sativa]|uniref:Uncharacterized protein n=1 Tax=Eruca vesicaria subsp. sativa TaxID=29727 RepID=A0ABC8LJT6_ERUVS|nr:unnamed protein product [Eruca vesicaria subsp. sativa]
MGFMHQELIEILSYAMVITTILVLAEKNHIYTSGASGTNTSVIRGALRAERPELLTVILPQSLKKQPPESQEFLSKVHNVVEKSDNDHLPLLDASRLVIDINVTFDLQEDACVNGHHITSTTSNLLRVSWRYVKKLKISARSSLSSTLIDSTIFLGGKIQSLVSLNVQALYQYQYSDNCK